MGGGTQAQTNESRRNQKVEGVAIDTQEELDSRVWLLSVIYSHR